MKRLLACLLVVAMAAPGAEALVSEQDVLLVGGTVAGVHAGALGRLDLARADALVFHSGDAELSVPYAGITNYEYTRKLARRIGVIPTIAVVAVLKRRQRKHFVTITFKDAQGTPQIAVFEVPKQMPQILLPILAARAPRATAKESTGHEHLFIH